MYDQQSRPDAYEMDSACSVCGYCLWLPIARLDVSILGLYDDSRFPGRCLLALREHGDDFAMLPPDIAYRYVVDTQHAARAIQLATSADRINYALFGNKERHMHAHLVPRRYSYEQSPLESPWHTPYEKESLGSTMITQVITEIRAALSLTAFPTYQD